MRCKCLRVVPLLLLVAFLGCYKPYQIVADITPPGEVVELMVNKQDVDVGITWLAPSDADLIGFNVGLYNSNNQRLVRSVNISSDTLYYDFEKLAPGNYYTIVRTRDKENNLSEGVMQEFVFLSKAPINVSDINARVHWNVIHVNWDSLTAKDFTTEVEGQTITIPVDSIIVEIDSAYRRIALPVTATGVVFPDIEDGYHSVKVYTHGESGFYSAIYEQTLSPITFGEKFVRVQGDGHDFYMARYEVTTEEYRKFVVDDLGRREPYGIYRVDNSKVENDKWFKWWYGSDPGYPGEIYLLGFNTWEFTLDANGWTSNRYASGASFGRATWEGAMLYSLLNYNGRCPTIDEWLYAARGGKLAGSFDYAGSNDPDAVGWWGWSDGVTFLNPPGQKQPNELGIYDMSGNASEILYDLGAPNGANTLGKIQIAGGSMGPPHHWGNEDENFGPDNSLKPTLSDPQVIKTTATNQNDARWRMGIRVLIPHEELVKAPVNRFLYER